MNKKLLLIPLTLSSLGCVIGSFAYSFSQKVNDTTRVLADSSTFDSSVEYYTDISQIPWSSGREHYRLYSRVDYVSVLRSLPRYDDLLNSMTITDTYSRGFDITPILVNEFYMNEISFYYNSTSHFFTLSAYGENSLDNTQITQTIAIDLLKWDSSSYYAYFPENESYQYYLGIFNPNYNVVANADLLSNNDYRGCNAWRTFVWYFTNATIHNYSLTFRYDLPFELTKQLNKNNSPILYDYLFYDNTGFYSDIYNTQYVKVLPLYSGSFSYEGNAYSTINLSIGSAYCPSANPNPALAVFDTSGRPLPRNDSSLQNYYYIDSIFLQGEGSSVVLYSIPLKDYAFGGVQYVILDIPNSNSSILPWKSTNARYLNVYYFDTFTINSQFAFSNLSQLQSVSIVGTLNYEPIIYQPPDITTTSIDSVFDWLIKGFTALFPLFNFMILPGISLGVIFLTPVMVGIMLFVVKLFKR